MSDQINKELLIMDQINKKWKLEEETISKNDD